jgi:hypothetical protein
MMGWFDAYGIPERTEMSYAKYDANFSVVLAIWT